MGILQKARRETRNDHFCIGVVLREQLSNPGYFHTSNFPDEMRVSAYLTWRHGMVILTASGVQAETEETRTTESCLERLR